MFGIVSILKRQLLPDPQNVATIQEIKLPSGQTVKFWCLGTRSAKRAARMLTKEPRTIAWLNQLSADDVVWDVGANIGVYSIYAAVERRARVIALEPGAANYFSLNKNIELNGLPHRVCAYCISLSSKSTFDRLYMPSTRAGAAFSMFGQKIEFRGDLDGEFTQGSTSHTLDELYRTLGPPKFIKIDTDGLEIEILSGGSECLSDRTVRSVRVEFGAEDQNAISSIEAAMAQYGFTYANKDEIPENHRSVVDAEFARSE